MKCIVTNCDHDTSASNPLGVTYYTFPPEPALREKWLRALHRQGCADDNIVCSDHFLAKDLFLTNSGQYLLRSEATPVLPNLPTCADSAPLCDVKVCRICFTTDCKLYSMIDNKKLNLAFQSLAGLMTDSEDEMPPYLCTVCAHRLLKASSFRAKSLQANLLLLEVVKKHQRITLETIKSVKHQQPNSSLTVTKKTDHYDLYIAHVKKEGEQTDLDEDVEFVNESRNDNVVEISKDQEINENRQALIEKRQKIVHQETVLHDVKIEDPIDLINDERNNDVNPINDERSNEKSNDENARNPVVVYIKSEAIMANEISCGDTTDDDINAIHDCNERENTSISNKVKCNDGKTIGEDSSATSLLKTNGEQPKLNSLKVQKFTSRDGQIIFCRQPKLKNVNLDKSNLLVPRLGTKTFRNTFRVKLAKQSGNKTYSCDVCSKSFEHKKNLQKHIKIHTGVKPYSCEICKKAFILKSKLNRHALTHSDKKKFNCKLCNQIFLSEYNLSIHLRIHSGEKPYSCEQCDAAYKDKRDLRKHLKKHLGVKPYSCDICNKSFIMKNKLMRHAKIHSDEKPFSCEVCTKSFRDKSNLQRHHRKHSGVRPYSCDVCNKSFTENAVLKGHLRIHTGERPYSCDICKRAFSRRGNFVLHIKTHSDEKQYLCSVDETEGTTAAVTDNSLSNTLPNENTSDLHSKPSENTSDLHLRPCENTSDLHSRPSENTSDLLSRPSENTSDLHSRPSENTSDLQHSSSTFKFKVEF